MTLIWSATAGKTYQVQYKSDLAELLWNALPGDVTARADIAAKVDSIDSSGWRFYRVTVVP